MESDVTKTAEPVQLPEIDTSRKSSALQIFNDPPPPPPEAYALAFKLVTSKGALYTQDLIEFMDLIER